MSELPKYYTTLFNAVEDALAELLLQNYGRARDLLIKGLQNAEEAYLESGEDAESNA